jgi:hypothetical protein
MARITTEVSGKVYELVPEVYICEGCDLKNKCQGCSPELVHSVFNGCAVCGKLHGIWKEVKDNEKTN